MIVHTFQTALNFAVAPGSPGLRRDSREPGPEPADGPPHARGSVADAGVSSLARSSPGTPAMLSAALGAPPPCVTWLDGTRRQLRWDSARSGRGTGQTLAFRLEQSVLNRAASPSQRRVTWHLPCARPWAWSGCLWGHWDPGPRPRVQGWSPLPAGGLALRSRGGGASWGNRAGRKRGGREGPHSRTSQCTDPFFSGELNIQSSVNLGFFFLEGAAGGEGWEGDRQLGSVGVGCGCGHGQAPVTTKV